MMPHRWPRLRRHDRARRRRELARADRVLPGLWRLRLPLPWPGVPHVNAFAIAAGSGVVLVDTGLLRAGRDAPARARARPGRAAAGARAPAGLHPRPLGPLRAGRRRSSSAAGCELWMHPNHAPHDEGRAGPRARVRAALRGGAPERRAGGRAARATEAERARPGLRHRRDRDARPRPACPGVEVDTDLGTWQVYETPGHAPSHVVLHQPERGLLLSGDHLLGRVSLYYDYGYSPDPAGEFLREPRRGGRARRAARAGRPRPPGARRARARRRPTAARCTSASSTGARGDRERRRARRSRSCPTLLGAEAAERDGGAAGG